MNRIELLTLAGQISTSSADSWDKHLKIVQKRRPNKEDKEKFLEKLIKKGHYSVFEHSPIMFKDYYCSCDGLAEAGWLYPRGDGINVYGNERHLLDSPISDCIEEYTLFSSEEIYNDDYLVVFRWNTELPFYTVFTFKLLTRAATHQLVRHKTLSYTQQSLRYTKIEHPKDLMPQNVEDLSIDEINFYYDVFEFYKHLLKQGYRKEDARRILPLSTRTNIVISGYKPAWEHFIKIRSYKSAQKEIRNFALKLKEIFSIEVD